MGVLSSSGATVAITVLSSLLLATSLSLLQERQITADLTATLSSSSSSSSPPYVMEREKSVEGIDPLSKFKGKDANATMIQHQQRQQQRPPLKTCLDPNGPQPYILLTLGRSGSGSTWQAIGTLTGYVHGCRSDMRSNLCWHNMTSHCLSLSCISECIGWKHPV